jgi:hypothetical protein
MVKEITLRVHRHGQQNPRLQTGSTHTAQALAPQKAGMISQGALQTQQRSPIATPSWRT